jgi:hypothetical protein
MGGQSFSHRAPHAVAVFYPQDAELGGVVYRDLDAKQVGLVVTLDRVTAHPALDRGPSGRRSAPRPRGPGGAFTGVSAASSAQNAEAACENSIGGSAWRARSRTDKGLIRPLQSTGALGGCPRPVCAPGSRGPSSLGCRWCRASTGDDQRAPTASSSLSSVGRDGVTLADSIRERSAWSTPACLAA